MNTIHEILSWFLKQDRNRRLMIGGVGLVLLVALCGLFSAAVYRAAQQAPAITATYNGASSVIFKTWTPAITDTPSPTSTATVPPSTRTPLPTGLPTQSLETATLFVLPTNFVPPSGPDILVVITGVDKQLEYADIQNTGPIAISLRGWTLVSEIGEQACPLRGILQPKQVLRIWAGVGPTGSTGINCEFKNNIWLDQEPDPAVLYNAKGQEVSRFPKP